jgi:hypothetical protein
MSVSLRGTLRGQMQSYAVSVKKAAAQVSAALGYHTI